MANSLNYRIKIDLSQFYDDVRKLSYVYVSEKNISHILHLYERIKDVFGINRSFYLISNEGVYLPLNEDIRIVQENETIKVCPGSGSFGCLTVWRETGVKCNGQPLPTIQVQKDVEKMSKSLSTSRSNIIANTNANNLISNENSARKLYDNRSCTVTGSELQCPDSPSEDSDTDTPRSTKNTTGKTVLGLNDIPRKKRKRIRKRKLKQSPDILGPSNNHSSALQNTPLVFNPKFTPTNTPKHLKFNWDENEEYNSVKSTARKESNAPEVSELKTLLDLRNSTFPVTFVGQKVKKANGVTPDHSVADQCKADQLISENTDSQKNSVDIGDISQINVLNFPIYNQELLVGDIVAFRTLKMAEDYSPTVSGYIVGEVLSRNVEKSDYSFKIISGEDQLKNPEGKFSLPTDTEKIEATSHEFETVMMHYTELIEPRLINRKIA